MKKNIYSIALNKEVVDKIDGLAFAQSTNRSSLINNILSEYVSINTPESVINNIFEILKSEIKANKEYRENRWNRESGESRESKEKIENSKNMNNIENNILQLQEASSKRSVLVKNVIKYKYNPIVKYIFGMYYDKNKFIGSLKVSVRTQNDKLITLMEQFFNILEATEKGYIDFKDNIFHKVENGSLERIFVFPDDEEHSPDKVGAAVFNYIQTLDRLIKIYFSNFENLGATVDTIDKIYNAYIKKCEIVA